MSALARAGRGQRPGTDRSVSHTGAPSSARPDLRIAALASVEPRIAESLDFDPEREQIARTVLWSLLSDERGAGVALTPARLNAWAAELQIGAGYIVRALDDLDELGGVLVTLRVKGRLTGVWVAEPLRAMARGESRV